MATDDPFDGYETPGHRIVAKLGGVKETAFLAGRSTNTVWRWLEPVESGGHGGLIPTPAQKQIIAHAARQGIQLTHADFAPQGEERVAA